MAALDKLTAEEEAQLKQMEADDLASASTTVEAVQDGTEAGEVQGQEPPAEAVEEAHETPEKPGFVDKRALDQERERRRKAEASLAEERQKNAAEYAKVQTRLELLAQAAQEHVTATAPRAPDPEPAPDFSTDPAGFIQHQFKSVHHELARNREEINTLRDTTQHVQQQTQQQAQNAALQQWGAAQEAEFARNQPDYQQAVTHLRNARERILQAAGINDPVDMQNRLQAEVMQTAAMAYQQGRSFGDVLYKLAGAHGYSPGATAAPAATEAQAAAVPITTPKPAATAAERLIRGQDMATTLGATGGAPRGELAPQAIANMSDADFDVLYSKVKTQGGQAMRNLFGV